MFDAWSAHPSRIVIESEDQFVDKGNAALHAVRDFLKTKGAG
jgi:hypothetical protein